MPTWEDVATHALAHETAHALDRSGSKRLSSTATWMKNGPVWREMTRAVNSDTTLAKLFEGVKSKTPKVASQELFAELAALKTTHPELAYEYFPEGTRALNKALESSCGGVSRLQPIVADGSPTVESIARAKRPDESGERVRTASAAGSDQGASRGQSGAVGLEHSKLEEDDSLDRSPDDPRSVAETVAVAKKNPAYRAVRAALDEARAEKPAPSARQSKMQAVVNRLSKGFGIAAPKVHFFDKGEFITHKGEKVSLSGDVGMLQHEASKQPVLHLCSDLQPHEAASVMLHEFGHYPQHSLFDKLKADDPVKQAVFADFKRWRAGLKGSSTARTIRASRAPFFNTLADLRLGAEGKTLDEMTPEEAANYLTSFSEYFADNMARALSAHGGVQDAAGAFFAHAAHAMKLVYDLFTGADRQLVDGL